jgi:hypothetical protein
MVARFSSEFVEARRRALERFLRRIASHAEFIESEIVVAFLENDPATLHKLKESRIAARSKASSSSKMSWFESTITQAINGGKTEVEKSAADEKVEEINQYLTQLEKQMSSTIKHSEHLVKRSRDISQAMFELGQSMTYLGQNEGDGLGTGLTQVIGKRNKTKQTKWEIYFISENSSIFVFLEFPYLFKAIFNFSFFVFVCLFPLSFVLFLCFPLLPRLLSCFFFSVFLFPSLSLLSLSLFVRWAPPLILSPPWPPLTPRLKPSNSSNPWKNIRE